MKKKFSKGPKGLKTDTRGWYAYCPPKEYVNTPIDLSFLNEMPAGRRGFVVIKDGHFAFRDGTRARFWGVNLAAGTLFMEHAKSDELALRLARLGVNLARLHHLDGPWEGSHIFDPGPDDTRSFNTDYLEKLDYLIHALKQNGIYVYLDLLCNRKFKAGDGVPDWKEMPPGARGVTHFSPEVRAANRDYAQKLLGHVNPHTGLALKDDPVVLGQEILNESSIFTSFSRQDFTPFYEAQLQRIYEERGGKGKITRFGYDPASRTLKAQRHPENAEQSLAILSDLQNESNAGVKKMLETMGAHGLLAGSNLGLHVLPDIWSNSLLDFMDAHSYWDHPKVWEIGWDWNRIDQAPITNQSQLKNPFDPGGLIRMISDWKVGGKPMVVTEWNACSPNQHRVEGPVLMAAYGGLQDWDAMLQFDFWPALAGSVKMHPFSINTRPDNQPVFQAAALMFRLGCVRPAKEEAVDALPAPPPMSLPRNKDLYFSQPWLPYAVRLSKSFGQGASLKIPKAVAHLHDAKARTIQASGKELKLDYGRGILRMESPKVQGWVGFVGTGRALQTGMIKAVVAKRNPFAALLLISLDNQDLGKSQKMALLAVARAEHTGQVWAEGHSSLVEGGQPPILMEGVRAQVVLDAMPGAKVTPVDEDGQALGVLSVKTLQGKSSFTISSRDKTAYYLVERRKN